MSSQPPLRQAMINRARDDFHLGKCLLDRVHPGAPDDDEREEENVVLEKHFIFIFSMNGK